MHVPRRRNHRPVSTLIADAFAAWRAIRADFDNVIEAAYDRAERDTAGNLLNRRGEHRGIDPRSLFYGPRARVDAYASDELREWFATHGRITFAEYETHRRQEYQP